MESSDDDRSGLGIALALAGADERLHAQWEKNDVRSRLFGTPPPLRRLGRYGVVRPLGRGGMGEVFAGHDDSLDRPVAIKVLHADTRDDDESRARMIREAKTLAKLSHPNVVQVYEVGEANGRVYIAMEFIAGTTLRAWVRRARPGWSPLVSRYMDAGRGLAAVHQAGLVHRDFKPENVLLGDDGRVCVADFGLARHASPPSSVTSGAVDSRDATLRSGSSTAADRNAPPTRLTQTGRIAGTPAYMAPEQLRGAEVDARADQFAFCVSLYEDLYGQRPFAGKTLATLAESHRAGAIPPSRRSPVPRRVWRVLARGLAADPHERFDTVEALLRALDPARARRRRRLLLGGLIGTATVAAWSSSSSEPPCPRPSPRELGWGSDARARVEAGLLATQLPYAPRVGTTVLAALDQRVDEIARAEQAACEATHVRHVQSESRLDERMTCLHGVRRRLRGLVDAVAVADPQVVDRAVRAVQKLPRPSQCGHEQVAWGTRPPRDRTQARRVQEARTVLDRAQAWLDLGHGHRARALLEDQGPAMEALGYPPLTAELRHLQGDVARQTGNPTRAAELLLEAGELADGSRHDRRAARIWSDLTFLGFAELSPRDGARWLPRARAAVRRIGSPPRMVTTITHHEGERARAEGDVARARTLQARVLAERRAQGDPLAVARAAAALATTLKLDDDPEGALRLHEEESRIYAEQLGSTHPRVAAAEYNVGALLAAMDRPDDARPRLNLAVDLWTARYGPDHLDLALAHIALQQVELSGGTLAAALEHARQARRIRRLHLPAEHIDVAEAEMMLGVSRFYAGDFDLAIESYRAAWDGLRAELGDDDPSAALARANLAEALLARGDHLEALLHASSAWDALREALPDHPASANALKVRGAAALAAGDVSGARTDLERALALLDSAATPLPLERGDLLLWLSRAHAAAGDLDRARAFAQDSARAHDAHPGPLGPRGAARAQEQLQRLNPVTPTRSLRP